MFIQFTFVLARIPITQTIETIILNLFQVHTEPIIVRACSKNQQDESELFPGINTHTAINYFPRTKQAQTNPQNLFHESTRNSGN